MSKDTPNLTEIFNAKLATFDDDEKAANFFHVGVSKVRKWRSGTAFPELPQCQKVLDEAFTGKFTAPVAQSDNLTRVLGPTSDHLLEDAAMKLDQYGAISIRIVAMPGAHEVTVLALDLAGLAASPSPAKTEGGETVIDPLLEPEVKLADLGPLAKKVSALPASVPTSEYAIMLPTHRDYPQAVMFSILGNWKATLPEPLRAALARLDGEPDTLIHVARNVLAHRFMQGNAQWSYWQDSDVIASFGNAGWFRKNAGCQFNDDHISSAAILRLRSRDKTVIGGCYSTRNGSGAIVAHPNFGENKGRETDLVNEVRKAGPRDRVIETPWLGFGCVLVHRSVFEAIQKLPDTPKYPDGSYGYFDPIPGLGEGAMKGQQAGEDIAFCKRAKDAGHQPHLDLSVVCGHVGRVSFMPHQ